MHDFDPSQTTRASGVVNYWAFAIGWLVLNAALAVGQGGDPGPLRVDGLVPVGGRTSVTEGWGTLGFAVENRAGTAREARVLVFYPERPDEQYARDLWVPAGARLTSWLPVGPAPPQRSELGREIKYIVSERTAAGGQQAQPPTEGERLRGRAVSYRQRKHTAAVFVDGPAEGEDGEVDPQAREAVEFVRTFRLARGLDAVVGVVTERMLPPTAEAFDGVDLAVLAGNRLAADPAGRMALRQWVERGGTLWVMLDRVEPATVAPILGDGFDGQVVSRTGLTTVRLGRPGDDPPEPRVLEQPVELVRVAVGDADTVHFTADGWPAAFSRPVGQGRVVVTTLGGRGWHQPRGAARGTQRGDRQPGFENFPDLPAPLPALERLAPVLYPEPTPGGLRPDDLAPMLTAEIGYAVLDRRAAGLILGGFVVTLVGLGVGLRWAGRAAAVGWLGPVAALAASGLFVTLGSSTRQAVPPTAAAAGVVAVTPGTGEGAATGLFAVYRPDSGPTRLAGDHGGRVDLDPAGLAGQPRRRVQTDLAAWHWEGLSLPAGVRLGPFQGSLATGPVEAVARFGPAGVEGRLTVGRFAEPADAVLLTQAGEPLAVRFTDGGGFVTDGPLPPGQFLAGTVLTDRQQRRQEVYRRLLTRPLPRQLAGRDLLLAWVSGPPPITFGEETRTVGEWLLVVPLAFEPPTAGSRVTVPSGVVPVWSLIQGRPRPLTTDSSRAFVSQLRFDLLPSLRSLTVERAVVTVRVRAAGRRVAVTGPDGAVLREAVGPLDPIRVEVTDPKLLRPDEAGGLRFDLSIGGRANTTPTVAGQIGADTGDIWRIEGVSIELVGRAGQ